MTDLFDIAVIGGGIHGVGAAQAAAAAGYKTAIIEKTDWAAGTSSKSSKLIHGGLRYLESAQLSLVFHSLQERRQLLRIAPTLVRPVPFLIPIYKETTRRPWQIRSGLSAYSLLSGLSRFSFFKQLPKTEWQNLDDLNTDGLQAVFQYWDAQTDDRLLTRAVATSAKQLGAEWFCPFEFISGEVKGNTYQLSLKGPDKEKTIQTKTIINAGGPWVNAINKRMTPEPPSMPIDLVQGAHIILDEPAASRIFYLESPHDQRAIFRMPWHGKTMIGTTETLIESDWEQPSATAKEIDYLLETATHYFPDLSSTVTDSFAGLRVLPRQNSSLFNRARESVFITDSITGEKEKPSYVSIYGGKLTSFRTTAKKTLSLLHNTLGKKPNIADIDTLILSKPDTDTEEPS